MHLNKTFYNKYANRGMDLEYDINSTNKYYLDNNIAVIYKKPTPIRVSKVSYKNNNSKIITEAFYEMPSTTDYNGIYKGKYIDFDAKEIKSKTSYALSNIHNHQLKHLEKVKEHGGIAFLIVKFTTNNIIFLIEIDKIIDFINNSNRKSIPISYFKENGYIVKESYIPRIDYLKVLDKIYFKMEDL